VSSLACPSLGGFFEGKMPKYHTYNGITLSQSQWAARLGISKQAMSLRLKDEWPPDLAFNRVGKAGIPGKLGAKPGKGGGRKPKYPKPGTRFGRWVVLGPAEINTSTTRKYQSWCRCDCGAERIVPNRRLRQGSSFRCGKTCPGHKAPEVFQEPKKHMEI
jgi:hypothetical protein